MLMELTKNTRTYRRFHQDVAIAEQTLKELMELARLGGSPRKLGGTYPQSASARPESLFTTAATVFCKTARDAQISIDFLALVTAV